MAGLSRRHVSTSCAHARPFMRELGHGLAGFHIICPFSACSVRLEWKIIAKSPTPADDPDAAAKTNFSEQIEAGRYDVSDVLDPLIDDFKAKNNLK